MVRADGELDLTTAPAFTRDLEDARHGTGRLFLIVDLSGATFMDGSILDPLCAAWRDCRGRGGWVRVVHPRRGPNLVFRAAGLLERFPRYASAQDACDGTALGRTGLPCDRGPDQIVRAPAMPHGFSGPVLLPLCGKPVGGPRTACEWCCQRRLTQRR
ncbi:STAS domain-containing protein [Streptomyces sp. NPDC047043]|uniref:STAS domain-containing protein n=1 Tax=Streptomyces sp. NPDC047043 TaxID=3154497 RepID=UPI0033F67EEC